MSNQELYTKIRATKSFLQKEIVKLRTGADSNVLSFREIGNRLDMIHEAERIGIRNLGEYENRKIQRMINELEGISNISLN